MGKVGLNTAIALYIKIMYTTHTEKELNRITKLVAYAKLQTHAI
jgi:hypothetical protein